MEKQKSAVRAIGFSFTNPDATVKNINFSNKSDFFYEGCPAKDGSVLCTKTVSQGIMYLSRGVETLVLASPSSVGLV